MSLTLATLPTTSSSSWSPTFRVRMRKVGDGTVEPSAKTYVFLPRKSAPRRVPVRISVNNIRRNTHICRTAVNCELQCDRIVYRNRNHENASLFSQRYCKRTALRWCWRRRCFHHSRRLTALLGVKLSIQLAVKLLALPDSHLPRFPQAVSIDFLMHIPYCRHCQTAIAPPGSSSQCLSMSVVHRDCRRVSISSPHPVSSATARTT